MSEMWSRKNQERWDELEAELQRVNKLLPSSDKLEGWAPKDVIEEDKVVLAEKKDEGGHILKEFKAIGIWKEVYDLLVLRNKIWDEMGEISEEEEGPAIFVPVESADETDD